MRKVFFKLIYVMLKRRPGITLQIGGNINLFERWYSARVPEHGAHSSDDAVTAR